MMFGWLVDGYPTSIPNLNIYLCVSVWCSFSYDENLIFKLVFLKNQISQVVGLLAEKMASLVYHSGVYIRAYDDYDQQEKSKNLSLF